MKKEEHIPEAQIERATSALMPFLRKWHLQLSPENLELMAYAVLKHAPGELSEEGLQRIEDDVSEMIDEDAAKERQMLAAQSAQVAASLPPEVPLPEPTGLQHIGTGGPISQD